jgi:tRNA(Arg) A34 adenosine deaminase TadA
VRYRSDMPLSSTETAHLERAIEVAALARSHGNHPFGAIFVTADGSVIEAENTVVTDGDPTGHAETNLVRATAASFDATTRATGTLYTSTEPCAMCAGAIYWAGINRVVFALPETTLGAMVMAGSGEETMDLPCREVFARGPRTIEVIGPVDLPRAAEVHAGFWG